MSTIKINQDDSRIIPPRGNRIAPTLALIFAIWAAIATITAIRYRNSIEHPSQTSLHQEVPTLLSEINSLQLPTLRNELELNDSNPSHLRALDDLTHAPFLHEVAHECRA